MRSHIGLTRRLIRQPGGSTNDDVPDTFDNHHIVFNNTEFLHIFECLVERDTARAMNVRSRQGSLTNLSLRGLYKPNLEPCHGPL